MFLVVYEFGVSFAIVAVANWDEIKRQFDSDPERASSDLGREIAEISVAVPSYTGQAKMNLYAIVVMLIIGGIMQIVAVVLHVQRRTELAHWFIDTNMDDHTWDGGSYGSSADLGKSSSRLAELRDYYAQLYAEHGLSVPSELRNPHPV